MSNFYVDACIYLNLWQMEGDERFGVPYWKIAQDFLIKVDQGVNIIFYSGVLLRELKFILGEKEFSKKRLLFSSSANFRKINIFSEDLANARKIEHETSYEISFYDILHMLLAEKSGAILITRDKKLLEIAKKYGVIAKRPEEFL